MKSERTSTNLKKGLHKMPPIIHDKGGIMLFNYYLLVNNLLSYFFTIKRGNCHYQNLF